MYEKEKAQSSDEKEEMDVQSMSRASSDVDKDKESKSSKKSQKVRGEEQDVCQEQLVALTVDKKKEEREYEQSSKLWNEEDGKFTCSLCPGIYNARFYIIQHLEVHTRNKEFKCHYCSASYNAKCDAEDHERLHTGDVLRCDICDKTFTWAGTLRKHLKSSLHLRRVAQSKGVPISDSYEKEEAESSDEKEEMDVQSMSRASSDVDKDKESKSSKKSQKVGGEEQDVCQEQLVALTVDKKKEEREYEQSSKLWNEEDGQFTCSLCPGTYSTRYSIIRHLEVHTRNSEFKCRYCSASYNAKRDTEDHERLHTGDVPRCDVCNKTFTYADTLLRHVKTSLHQRQLARSKGVPVSNSYEKEEAQSSDEKEEMDVQSMSSASSDADEDKETKSSRESQKVRGEKQDVCQEQLVAQTVDKKKEEGEYQQSSKLWNEEDGQFTCSLCPGTYSTRYSIMRHLEVHTRNMEFKCRYCSATYKVERHLEDHERLHTGDVPRCDVCNKTYRWADTLLRHVKTSLHMRRVAQSMGLPISDTNENDEDEYHEREEMDAQSMSSASSDADEDKETKSSRESQKVGEEKQDVCQEQLVAQTVAKKKEEGEYEQTSKLWKEEDGKFICSLCPGTYSTRYRIIWHLEVHTRNMEFKCRYCSASYKAERHLEDHERLHTGDVPRCDVCNKTFRWADTLLRHVKTNLHMRRVAQSMGLPVSDTNENDEDEYHEREEMDAQSMSSASSDADEDKETKSSRESQKVGEEEQDGCQNLQKTQPAKTRIVSNFDQNNETESHTPLACAGLMNSKQNAGVEKQSVDEGKKEEGTYEQSSQQWKEEDGQFICELCPSTYTIRYQIIRHMKIHNRNCAFKCQYCNASYNAERHQVDHERLHTVGDYRCDICCKTFKWGDTYKVHVRSVHQKIFVKRTKMDQSCDEKDNSMGDPEANVQRRLRQRTSTPCKSNTGAPTKEESTTEQVEGTSEKKYRRLARNSNHGDSETGAPRKEESKSPDIEANGGSQEKESKSDVTSHNPSQILHPCIDCPTTFHTLMALEKHRKGHSETEHLYKCDQCADEFSSVGLLNEHKKNHVMQVLECQHCSKKFPSMKYYNRHLVQHHNSTLFTCKFCQKKLPTSAMLEEHERRHKEDMKSTYKCEHCDKCFGSRKNLQRHLRNHKEVALHACRICGKNFVSLAFLTVHERSHSLQRNYKCKQCSKAYIYADHLKRHERMHEITQEPIAKHSRSKRQRLAQKGRQGKVLDKKHDQMQSHAQETLEVKKRHRTQRGAQNITHDKKDDQTQNLVQETVEKHDEMQSHAQETVKVKKPHHRGHGKKHNRTRNNAQDVVKVKRHRRVSNHTQDSAYQCEECKEEFSRSCSFKVHVLRKHKGMKFICWPCSSGFQSNAELVSHNRKCHAMRQQTREMRQQTT
ncbi:uncharacterized protein [Amphiura filiformis]|uniref:uncharacterized protein n=1 Tax=Amphiura filiformis TaxID=82378 RepID=UPI003B21897D